MKTSESVKTSESEWDRIERLTEEAEDQLISDLESEIDAIERGEVLPAPRCITGADADIDANYPGGLAAYWRDEPVDRSPHHKPDCE